MTPGPRWQEKLLIASKSSPTYVRELGDGLLVDGDGFISMSLSSRIWHYVTYHPVRRGPSSLSRRRPFTQEVAPLPIKRRTAPDGRCKAKTKAGRQCAASAIKGGKTCSLHADPIERHN
jgi:hypothetical protein